MPGGVKAQGHAVVGQALAVVEGLQLDVLTQTRAQNPGAGAARQVVLISGARVIAMGMGNHRTLDRPPRIDIEIPGGAVETFRSGNNKIHVVTGMGGLLAMRRA